MRLLGVKKLLFTPRAAIASVSSCRTLTFPLSEDHLCDCLCGLCRSLLTIILASLLVVPKTPEKQTTDLRDCAATPKKRLKRRVIVDMDETQADVDEGIALIIL